MGDAASLCRLGVCHEFGEGDTGIAKDYGKAQMFFALAVMQGFAQATEAMNRIDEKIGLSARSFTSGW